MKLKKLFSMIIIEVIVLCLLGMPVNADVGSFDRYDSGSSSSDSWSSSDWGSSSSSWSSDDWGSSTSSSYGGGIILAKDGWTLVGFFVAIIIFSFVINYFKEKRKQEQNEFDKDIPQEFYTSEVHDVPITHTEAEKIKNVDPLFSEDDFISWTKDLYVKMQHAWTARKWEEMRPLETEKLFEQHSMQLQEFIIRKRINVVDQIAVNYATILEFRQTEDKDIIDVALKATKKDYIIDEKTQNVLQGNKTQDRITVYKMTFERTKGKLTKKGTEELDAKNCPNCGAPLKITSSGKCEYCGSIVSTGIHDWVLSNIEPLRK